MPDGKTLRCFCQIALTSQTKRLYVSDKTLQRFKQNSSTSEVKRKGVLSQTLRRSENIRNGSKPLFLNVEAYAPAHRSLWRRMPKHFPGMSFHCYNEIPKTLTIGKLTKHHRKQLIPTGIALDILAAFILTDEIIEMVAIHKLD